MNRIDFYANDMTIQNLMDRYGAAFEKLGPQRFQLLKALAADSAASISQDLAAPYTEIVEELHYLDSRARAGVIAAIARRMWEDS